MLARPAEAKVVRLKNAGKEKKRPRNRDVRCVRRSIEAKCICPN